MLDAAPSPWNGPKDEADCIGAVGSQIEPLSPRMLCREVYERFRRDDDILAMAVVEDERPIGLVNRFDLTMLLARDFGRALYEGKPIARVMDRAPLVVEADLHVDALQAMIVGEKPSALMRGFILTRAGRYVGVGTALSLLRLTVARTQQRNRALEIARIEAEQASRSKSQFLANMSHELRTPLNAIIGFAELIDSEIMGKVEPPQYREYVKDIHSSGTHLLSLINDVLDMAKIEAGRLELHEEQVDLTDLVGSAVRLFATRAETNKLHLSSWVDPTVSGLLADGRAVRQILLNLLSNAVKFTLPGGTVDVRGEVGGDGGVVLSVKDTGIGIAAKDLPLVTQPFGQVHNELTRRHPGTGLGLALVRSLADLHRARLEIDSVVGGGTTVAVFFPPTRTLAAERLRA